jgi:hypothetical protein
MALAIMLPPLPPSKRRMFGCMVEIIVWLVVMLVPLLIFWLTR